MTKQQLKVKIEDRREAPWTPSNSKNGENKEHKSTVQMTL